MLKRIIYYILLLCLGVLSVGCGKAPIVEQPKTASAYSVTDSTGYVLTLPHKPQRIVSLTLGTDEILTSLVSTDKIAALTYLADDPEISNVSEAAKGVSVKIKDATAETILALQPDLVIIADWMRPDLIQTMRELHVPLYVYHTPDSIDEIKAAIQNIAQVVQEPEKGQAIINTMDQDIAKIQGVVAAIPENQRQIVIWGSIMGTSGGQGSLFDDMCRLAGVRNGATLIGLGKNDSLSKESIVKANPDFILLPSWNFQGKWDVSQYRAELENDPALQSIAAIKNRRLEQVADRYLFTSSQYVIQGIRGIFKAAYPNKPEAL